MSDKNWTDLPQDKILEFISSIFKQESIIEDTMFSVLNLESMDKCIFRSLRNPQDLCSNNVDTPYGYCNKHITTLQAKTAKSKWESLKSNLDDPVDKALLLKEIPKKSIDSKDSKESSPKRSLDSKKSIEQRDPSPIEPIKRTAKIIRNKHGNFVHKESNIVFDRKSQSACGYQHDNGDVYSLNKEQIEFCIKHGWPYMIPESRIVNNDDESEEDSDESDSSDDSSEE